MSIKVGDTVTVRPKVYNLEGEKNGIVVGVAGPLVEVLVEKSSVMMFSQRVTGKYLRVGTTDCAVPAQILVGDYPALRSK